MDEKLMDIKVLAELKLDIIKNGKIRKEDVDRIENLDSIMNKYTYGWYIAMETLEEQLQSITKFEQYILSIV